MQCVGHLSQGATGLLDSVNSLTGTLREKACHSSANCAGCTEKQSFADWTAST